MSPWLGGPGASQGSDGAGGETGTPGGGGAARGVVGAPGGRGGGRLAWAGGRSLWGRPPGGGSPGRARGKVAAGGRARTLPAGWWRSRVSMPPFELGRSDGAAVRCGVPCAWETWWARGSWCSKRSRRCTEQSWGRNGVSASDVLPGRPSQ